MNANVADVIQAVADRYRTFGDEFIEESDRGVAILMLCVLEEDLKKLFQALVAVEGGDVRGLAPAGRLSSSIENAVLLGLLRVEEASTFLQLAKVRNQFAHNATQRFSFEVAPVRDFVDAIVLPLAMAGEPWDRQGYPRRDVFLFAASMLEVAMGIRWHDIERLSAPLHPHVIVARPPPPRDV